MYCYFFLIYKNICSVLYLKKALLRKLQLTFPDLNRLLSFAAHRVLYCFPLHSFKVLPVLKPVISSQCATTANLRAAVLPRKSDHHPASRCSRAPICTWWLMSVKLHGDTWTRPVAKCTDSTPEALIVLSVSRLWVSSTSPSQMLQCGVTM